jgi:hypothetical protein
MHPEMGGWSRQCETMRARGTFRGATVQPEATTLRLCLAQVWNSRLALYVMPCDRARLRIWTDEAESSPERRSVGASSRLPNPGHGGDRACVLACVRCSPSVGARVRAFDRACVRACAAPPAPTDSHLCVRMHTSVRPVLCSGVSSLPFVRSFGRTRQETAEVIQLESAPVCLLAESDLVRRPHSLSHAESHAESVAAATQSAPMPRFQCLGDRTWIHDCDDVTGRGDYRRACARRRAHLHRDPRIGGIAVSSAKRKCVARATCRMHG